VGSKIAGAGFMRIFFSVGEPSGDQHAAHLIAELRRRRPDLRVFGYGGPLMEQSGCQLLFQLTNMAVMGVLPVLPLLWRFYQLVRRAGQVFRDERPDAVVLVDFPGFNWWIARKAKAAGIPVIYYLPPQLWAWAPWRVKRMRKSVDRVLSALPFEKKWYETRGVAVEYVGHPIFDEVAARPLDREFARQWESAVLVVGLLPGSRNREVTSNWPVILEVSRRLHERFPGIRFLIANYKDSQRQYCEGQLRAEDRGLPLHFFVGKTPEIIARANCCLMVSGSVSLEMLARATPAAALYRTNWGFYLFVKSVITCKYMSLPNLMADRMVMPEFYLVGNVEAEVRKMTDLLHGWLSDPAALSRVRHEMTELRRDVAVPGAIERAAEAVLRRVERGSTSRAA
jgi:lipid-A-disaccharide synthase